MRNRAWFFSVLFVIVILVNLTTPIGLTPTEAWGCGEYKPTFFGIAMYEHENCGGRVLYFEPYRPSRNLTGWGMNDTITTVRNYGSLRWQICEHANYQGNCTIIPRESVVDLRYTSVGNDRASSIRAVTW